MATEIDCPVVVLSSGEKLEVRRVRLYEADKVQEIASLKATAAKQLAGVSMGIGFWGDPAWVLGGATVLGVIEGFLSAAARKQGIELLDEVQSKFQEMVEGAIFFDAAAIKNLHAPHPQAWFASKIGVRYLDVTQVPQRPLQNLLKQHDKTESDIEIINGTRRIATEQQITYVHDGDEFVEIESNTRLVNVRWSHVVAYFPTQMK